MVESSKKVKPWRDSVAWAGIDAQYRLPFKGPVRCEIVFSLRRPKSAPKRVLWPSKKPDLDKLVRSTMDGITSGGVWEDDALCVELSSRKVFAGGPDKDALPVPGAVIRVWEVEAC